MPKTKTIVFYADPGHGWARVPRAELEALGLLSAITAYSYQRKAYVYLEEDCDLGLYIKALKNRHGDDLKIKFREYVARERTSKIRSYARFSHI